VNKLLPKRSLDIALAIDSSRSMAPHKKLLYAKKAAVGLALAASKIGDRVKVLAFSDFATSIVNVRLKVDKRFLRKITRIRPLNSTNVEAALKKGTEIINNRNAGGQRHIILITDGVSTSCSAFFNSKTYPSRITSIKAAYTQAKRCRSEGISISTICIDVDEHIDRDFCLTLSRLGKGRSYFLKDPRKLPNATLHEYSKMKSSID